MGALDLTDPFLWINTMSTSTFELSRGPFLTGQAIDFHYPEKNLIYVPPSLNRRLFAVMKVLDFERHPIEEKWLRRNPGVRRGRFLVRGFDLRCHEWRQFYCDSMWRPSVVDIPLFRLATYDPVMPGSRLECVGPIFTDSRDDQWLMKNLIKDVTQDLSDRGIRRNVTRILLQSSPPVRDFSERRFG